MIHNDFKSFILIYLRWLKIRWFWAHTNPKSEQMPNLSVLWNAFPTIPNNWNMSLKVVLNFTDLLSNNKSFVISIYFGECAGHSSGLRIKHNVHECTISSEIDQNWPPNPINWSPIELFKFNFWFLRLSKNYTTWDIRGCSIGIS